MSVYFHGNFKLNRGRLAGILSYLINEPKLNEEEIGGKFGYKAPFTKRYKSWLRKCGILKNTIKVELTDFGKIIYKKDSKLIKEPTLWYMYNHLISSEDIAESWNYFHYKYLPKNKSFTKSELSNALSMKLMAHHPSHFGKNAPMIKVITKVLLDSYISEKAFGPLNLLKLKEGVFVSGKKGMYNNWGDIKTFSELY